MQAEQRARLAKDEGGVTRRKRRSRRERCHGNLGRRPLTEEEVHGAGVVKRKREVGCRCLLKLSEQEGMRADTLLV